MLLAKLNPFTKALILVSFCAVFFADDTMVLIDLALLFAVISLLARVNLLKRPASWAVLTGVGVAAYLMSTLWSHAPPEEALATAATVLMKFGLVTGSAIVIAHRTTPSENVYVLRRLTSRPAVVVPMITAFRLVPKLSSDARQVALALRARGFGVQVGSWRQLPTLALTFVFALMTSFIVFLVDYSVLLARRADGLRPKSLYRVYRMSLVDWCFTGHTVLLAVAVVWLALRT
jgi:energy-coupling factor transporter transmembrane protein EcfT